MGYNPQESLENTINAMGTLLGVHPIVRWIDRKPKHKWWHGRLLGLDVDRKAHIFNKKSATGCPNHQIQPTCAGFWFR